MSGIKYKECAVATRVVILRASVARDIHHLKSRKATHIRGKKYLDCVNARKFIIYRSAPYKLQVDNTLDITVPKRGSYLSVGHRRISHVGYRTPSESQLERRPVMLRYLLHSHGELYVRRDTLASDNYTPRAVLIRIISRGIIRKAA